MGKLIDADWAQALEKAREVDALFIVDEVQTGMMRTEVSWQVPHWE